MQNQEECGGADGADAVAVAASCEFEDWGSFGDEDILQQKSHISAEEAEKIPFVADKEPISALEAEYQSGSAILLEKIKILGEQYAAIRRTRGDGNCFFRSFMFSYLEHILDSQDRAEVNRIRSKVEECRKTLQSLGYTDFTFEDFFALFLEQLESVLQGNESSISHDELIIRSRDQSVSDYVVMFFRFVTSGEIQRRREFFEPFVMGLTNGTLEQFCKSAVEPMGEESDHVHITALSDALGVPIRVVYLDRSSCDTGGLSVNHHDFIPTASNLSNSTSGSTEPYITLLYRPGHYDILYPKVKASAGSASLPRCSLFLLVKHTVHGYLFKKWQDIVDGFLVALLGGQWRFNNPVSFTPFMCYLLQNVDIVLARCSQSNLSLTGPKGLSSSFRAVTYMVSKLSTCL